MIDPRFLLILVSLSSCALPTGDNGEESSRKKSSRKISAQDKENLGAEEKISVESDGKSKKVKNQTNGSIQKSQDASSSNGSEESQTSPDSSINSATPPDSVAPEPAGGDVSPSTTSPGPSSGTVPPSLPAPGPVMPLPSGVPTKFGSFFVDISCSDRMIFTIKALNGNLDQNVGAPKICAQLQTALHGKMFPSGTTQDELVGGAALKAQCLNGNLTINLSEIQGSTSSELVLKYDINDEAACREMRNAMNNLKI